jgi:hypothetical protein
MIVKIMMRIVYSCQWRINCVIMVVESASSLLTNDAAYELMESNTIVTSPSMLLTSL